MELLKILKNKKFMLAIISLLIFNCVAFYVTTEKSFQKEGFSVSVIRQVINENKECFKAGQEDLIEKKCEDFTNLLDFINTENPESLPKLNDEKVYQAYLNNEYSKSEICALAKLYYFYNNQNEYQKTYKQYISSNLEKADELMASNLFVDKNSFAYKSVEKEADDFSDNLNIELSFVNDLILVTLFDYQIGDFVLILIGLIVILSFISNQRFNSFIYTCKNGRAKLCAKRMLILSAFLIISSCFVFYSQFIISNQIYLIPFDWHASIQSSALFKDCTYKISFLQFGFIYIIYKSIVSIMISLLFWVILSFISNVSIATGISGLFIAIEYYLFTNISYQSNLGFFKTFNVFSLMNFENITTYNLVSFFSIPIRLDVAILFVVITVLCVSCIGLLILSNCNYPVKSPNKFLIKFNKLFDEFDAFYCKLQSKIYNNRFESFKVMHIGKGLIFIIILIVILGFNTNSNYVQLSPVDTMLNDYYASYGGELDDGVYDSITDLEKEIQKADEEYKLSKLLNQQGKISFEEYNIATAKYSTYETKREVLTILKQQVNRLENLDDSEIKPVLINETAYNSFFNENNNQKEIIIALFFVIIIYSSMFSFEKTSGMIPLNHSTRFGRNKLFLKKILTILPKSLFICLVSYLSSIIKINNMYEFTFLNANIKNLECLQYVNLNLSILEYLILNFVFEFVFVTIVGLIVMSLSLFVSQITTFVISSVLFLIPSLLYSASFHALKNVALVYELNLNLLLKEQMLNIKVFILHIFLTVLATISVIFCAKKWCSTNRR